MNLSKFLNQTAVYWAPRANDGYGGLTYSSPVEVSVRWALKQEEFLSRPAAPSPAEVTVTLLSSVVVLLETDLEYNGRMALGTLDSLTGLVRSLEMEDDLELLDALEMAESQQPNLSVTYTIKGLAKIPDIKAQQFLRKLWLT